MSLSRQSDPPLNISIVVEKTSSDSDEENSNIPSNILAFDGAVLEVEDDCDFPDSDEEGEEEDNQSRSSSTDLNYFLQIKQVGQFNFLMVLLIIIFPYCRSRNWARQRPGMGMKWLRWSAVLLKKTTSARKGTVINLLCLTVIRTVGRVTWKCLIHI